MSELTDTVLHVLASQVDGYLIQPDATAFVVQGLDPAEVVVALSELETQGHAQRTNVIALVQKVDPATDIPVVGENGEAVMEDLIDPATDQPVVIGEGWEAGAKATIRVVAAARKRLGLSVVEQ